MSASYKQEKKGRCGMCLITSRLATRSSCHHRIRRAADPRPGHHTMTERRSRSSSREAPHKQRDSAGQGSKRGEKKGNPGRPRSEKVRDPPKNDGKVSAVVNVDDVVASDEETEVMALLEGEQREDVKSPGLRLCELLLTVCCALLAVLTFPLSVWFCIKILREYERAVIFRLGRLLPGRARGPGICFYLPILDKCTKLDLRIKTFQVPFHQIVTKDLVTLEVDAICYYRLENAALFLTSVNNVSSALQLLIQSTTKRLLAHRSFLDILLERKSIGEEVKVALDAVTCHWGIKVERTEIKDINLPEEVKRSMAAEAEAQRHSKVKILAAECEKTVSESLKVAAESLSGSPTAVQLRYLHTLQCMTSEKPATFLVPFPYDLMNLNILPNLQAKNMKTDGPKSDTEAERDTKKDSPML
ncbi:podocin isoform X2 [Hyla sarda]|uniref:podocin isoform X2 n=1 Tax=Hyla sarda TaxID=327740 RepID=UPI0024C2E54A|nr:podocin isoform X2 [Hyla sarda]